MPNPPGESTSPHQVAHDAAQRQTEAEDPALFNASEILSTVAINILLDLPVFADDTTEPYFRASTGVVTARERRTERFQNHVPLLQLAEPLLLRIVALLAPADVVGLGMSCKQMHALAFGEANSAYWARQLDGLCPSPSLLLDAPAPAVTYRRCAMMRRHWRSGESSMTTHEAHMSLIRSLEFDTKAGTLISGSSDKKVKFWRYEARELVCERTVTGQNCGVVALHPTPDSLRIGYKNGVVKDLCVSSGVVCEYTTEAPVTGFSFRGSYVLGYERCVLLFDPTTLRPAGEYSLHRRPVSHAKMYDEWTGASSSFDKTVDLWDVRRLTTTAVRLKGHHAGVNHFDFAGERVITASNDKTLMAWDLRQPRQPLRTLRNHTAEVIFVRADRDRVLSSSKDMTLGIYDPVSFDLLSTITTRATISSLVFDDWHLFCGSTGGDLLVYDFT